MRSSGLYSGRGKNLHHSGVSGSGAGKDTGDRLDAEGAEAGARRARGLVAWDEMELAHSNASAKAIDALGLFAGSMEVKRLVSVQFLRMVRRIVREELHKSYP